MRRNIALCSCVIVGLFCMPNVTVAVPYSTDFSTDPGWTTDQPANYYWDATNQWYHARVENNAPAYQPNRYFGKLLPPVGPGFALSWDVQVASMQWSSAVEFGLFDSQLKAGAGLPGQAVFATLSYGDSGRSMGLYADGVGGRSVVWGPYNGWQVGQWYTCTLGYDPATDVATFGLRDRGTGTPIWQTGLLVLGGGFSNDLVFLGGSRYGMGDDGNYSGVNRGAAAQANIDNVYMAPIPAPGAVVLVGIGASLVTWLRRRGALCSMSL